jgi:hypothetical protein
MAPEKQRFQRASSFDSRLDPQFNRYIGQSKGLFDRLNQIW